MYTCCRLGLTALLFLVAAALSVACSEGDGTLPPAVPDTVPPPAQATAPAGEPNATLATKTPTETPVPATPVTATLEAATSPPAAEERRNPGGGITVRASGSASAPSLSLLRGADRFNLSPLGQFPGGIAEKRVSDQRVHPPLIGFDDFAAAVLGEPRRIAPGNEVLRPKFSVVDEAQTHRIGNQGAELFHQVQREGGLAVPGLLPHETL